MLAAPHRRAWKVESSLREIATDGVEGEIGPPIAPGERLRQRVLREEPRVEALERMERREEAERLEQTGRRDPGAAGTAPPARGGAAA